MLHSHIITGIIISFILVLFFYFQLKSDARNIIMASWWRFQFIHISYKLKSSNSIWWLWLFLTVCSQFRICCYNIFVDVRFRTTSASIIVIYSISIKRYQRGNKQSKTKTLSAFMTFLLIFTTWIIKLEMNRNFPNELLRFEINQSDLLQCYRIWLQSKCGCELMIQ